MSQADERLTELETQLAFQERLIQELNDALARQQERLDGLERRLLALSRRADGGDAIRRPEEELPPPHY
jgi:SlyX protein